MIVLFALILLAIPVTGLLICETCRGVEETSRLNRMEAVRVQTARLSRREFHRIVKGGQLPLRGYRYARNLTV